MRFPFLHWRFSRYTMVGAICAGVHNLNMIVGDRLGVHYIAMSFVSLTILIPLGYVLHANFTFREPMRWSGLVRFAWTLIVGFPLSLLLMALFVSGLGLPVIIATPLTTVLLFVWNYITAHWAVLGRLRVASPPEP